MCFSSKFSSVSGMIKTKTINTISIRLKCCTYHSWVVSIRQNVKQISR